MHRRRVSAVTCLLLVVVPLLAARPVSASPICESSLPSNIDGGMVEPILIELLQHSAVVRQQCAQIAAAQMLRMTVRISTSIEPGARALTTITRYDSGALRAEVVLRFSEDYFELLAHEFEHVLEQIEGVNLRTEVAARRAWVTPDGAFETRRAHEAGVRARHELDDELTAGSRQSTQAGRHAVARK